MPNPTLNLDDIQLPEDDGVKPAEVNLDPNIGDEGVVADPDEKKEDKKEEVKETSKEDENPDDKKEEVKDGDEKKEIDPNETEEEKKAREDKEAKDAEDKKKKEDEEKLTPFHEHPDWKKMVAEREEDKKVIEKLTTQIDTIMKVKGIDAEEKETMVVTAKERIKKDLEAGWKPADQLELVEKYGEYLKEEIGQQKEAEKKVADEQEAKRNEAVQEAEKQINTFWTENKVEDAAVKDQVLKLVLDWKADGTIPTPTVGTLKLAYDVLKSRGELKTEKKEDKKPEKADGADKKTKEELDKKKEVLKKAVKPTSSGDKPNQDGKKAYSSMAKRSLDDIVNDAAAALG